MSEGIKQRLEEIGRLSREGYFGEKARQITKEYQALGTDATLFLRVINDFYSQGKLSIEPQQLIFQNAEVFARLTIVTYREAKRQDPIIANSFLLAFVRDYPNINNSCLLQKWETLTRASLGFTDALKTSPVLVWEQSKSLFQAYNEFLSGLLGYYVLCWRTAKGLNASPNILTNPFAAKLNEFRSLTGGDNGAFQMVFKVARPDIRNAIAHGTIWLDERIGKVKYIDRGQNWEIDLIEYLGLAAIGSHLGSAYLTAIAAIVLLEQGNEPAIAEIPNHLVNLFRFTLNTA